MTGRRQRLWLRSVAAAVVAAACSACQIDIDLAVDAASDAAGELVATVTLDADAVARVPDIGSQLSVDDLRASGWTVESPEAKGGGLTLQARRAFEHPDDLATIAGQLSGEQGPFRGFRLERDRSFLKTKTTFTGTVDLRAGAEAFTDPAVTERLGGQPFGVDEAQLDDQLGVVLDRIIRVRVGVDLPGAVTSNAPAGDGVVWRPAAGEQVQMTASGEDWNRTNIAWAFLSLLAALGAVATALRQRSVRRHRLVA